MPQDYSSTKHQNDGDLEQSQEGPSSSSSSSPPQRPNKNVPPFLEPAMKWILEAVGSSKGEYAPLINRGKGTLELPRKTRRKVIVTVAAIVGTLFIIGGLIAYTIMHSGGEKKHRAPRFTDPEKVIIDVPSSISVREFLRTYTSEAHLAGSEADKRQAEWTRDKFIEFGISDTKIETYYPLLNYPIDRQLAIVSGPEELRYKASLKEDVVEEDKTSFDPDAVPTFHGYSKNGTALGPVVYANYGRVEDFQFLVDRGVNLKGTIALMRYGGAFRGLKVRAAEQFGCIGALIYSDPIDDGPVGKENHNNPALSYPGGPWRSPSSVQRGSVQYASLLTGDPLTPGWAATEHAERLNRDDSPGLPQIPSLPLSYQDALPLLRATQNHGVCEGEDWAGGLDQIEYCSGPSEGNVYLANIVDDHTAPIWNVVGRIEGAEEPEHAVILGNHRDAWVYGAVDPSSGSAAMLELVRTLGALLKKGWKPRRTIIIVSFDAEEYGMVGSTEWVEDHRDWLNEHASVYVNVDMGVSGPNFMAKACPSLRQVLYDVTSQVEDPRSNGGSVYEAWRQLTNADTPAVGQLGSGSDFVAFISHVGISSVDFRFEGDYGVYHSNYDSFHWMEKFGDPTFKYHETLVKIWGLLTLRLSDDPVLPLYPGDYSAEIKEYAEKLPIYETFGGPYKPFLKSLKKLTKATRRFERRRGRLVERLEEEFSNSTDSDLPSVLSKRMRVANERLTHFERGFIDPEGLKGRPWFKHILYAPHILTGYQSQVFPALSEALESGDTEEIGQAIQQTAGRIRAAIELLKADFDDDEDDDDDDDDDGDDDD
ncbi:hypothetical protein BDB00DRAFT_977223 [Zychaea mexicana]|uniref:uncharacterized protein n=1 Tax=Zychaea mexicana TaxID=64656 RepID=UPI0022FEFFEF|nr:uncharacterized protein BDB00DRAFT_977223 [Zychaea mexicana]KAI9492132.1 hypothetical protein BDB00DRAFT_977223 [Zychaea mexicana]